MATPHDVHGGVVHHSFLQPPFVRAAALPPPQQPDATIRLFGRDFSNDVAAGQLQLPKEDAADGAGVDPSSEGEAASRKFECHYCCRNFPTSQALGGHQNAHKRERQNARRAHLEASLAAHCGTYLPAGHLYGMFGYGGAHLQAAMSPMPTQYPTVWAGAGAVPGMYGGGVGSVARSAAYGGMTLPGMWRPLPVGGANFGATRRHDEATALVASGEVSGKDGKVVMSVVTSLPSFSSCLSGRSPAEIGLSELGQMEGVVSLDLCL